VANTPSEEIGSRRTESLAGLVVEMQTVDRRLAARSQINRAISLMMISDDIISATVLAWAGTDILRGCLQAASLQTWSDGMDQYGDKQQIRTIFGNLKFHYNYLKHARDDLDRIIRKLSPDVATLLLYGAAFDYETLYGCLTREMMLARLWALARMPDVDWPSVDLGNQIQGLFGNPVGKPFSEAREGAVGVFLLAEQDKILIDSRLFGGPSVRTLCDYPNRP
jgi:hypothetical protein